MQPELILQSDVLDIIFENRNKEYGAYELRSQYDKRLKKSLVIIFSIFFSLIGLFLMRKHFFPTVNKQSVFIDLPVTELTRIPEPRPDFRPREKPIHQRMVVQRPFTKPLITRIQPSNPPPTMEELSKSIISNKSGTGQELIAGEFLQDNQGTEDKGKAAPNGEPEENSNLEKAEIMPEFPGGLTALQRFLSRNLKPPADGMEPGSIIKVLVKFVVDRDGSITGIEFEQSGGREYDNEVLRVMKKMPSWKPGMQNGRTVRVYFKIPVVFQSQADN
jgi:periplasmic protein TonB